MKIAIARGGLWFCGVWIFLFVFGVDDKTRKTFSGWEILLGCGIIALIVGLIAFFWTWHDELMEEKNEKKKLQTQEDHTDGIS